MNVTETDQKGLVDCQGCLTFAEVSITNVSHFLRTNPDSGIAEKEDADLWPPSGISLADHGLASYRILVASPTVAEWHVVDAWHVLCVLSCVSVSSGI